MPVVELASDARYRRDPDGRYVEVCPACDAPRAGEACACGHAFTRLRRGFFTLRWAPAQIDVRFPDRCPHCGGRPSRAIAIWNQQATRASLGGRYTLTDRKLEVPVCAAVWQPIWIYLLRVVVTTLLVMAGLLALYGALGDRLRAGIVGGVLVVALGAALVALARRTSIRFGRFDHRSYRIWARDRAYADDLATGNGGRVL